MPTVPYKDSLKAIVERNPHMAAEMLEDAINALLAGELDEGRLLLRQYVNATIGFPELARLTGKADKNLMRSLGPTGSRQSVSDRADLHGSRRPDGGRPCDPAGRARTGFTPAVSAA